MSASEGRSAASPPAGSGLPSRWLRRALTLPCYVAAFAATALCLPLLVALAVAVDLLRGASWTATRVAVFFVFYLGCETVGIAASLGLWLARAVGLRSRDDYLRDNFRLQCWWGRTLGGIGFAIFGLRLEVDCDYEFGRRPILVFIRHASVADTVLPVMLISNAHDIGLRYVLKKELLWDPCLDIVGNRLPNYFAERGSSDGDAEAAAVAALAEGLTEREGVLIYPEGTRYSAAKKARIEERLMRKGETAALAASRSLRKVLPPRPRGSLALLRANQGADVVFMAHSGLEGSASFLEFWNGRLDNQVVRVKIWGVPYEQIPKSEQERIEWLHRQWSLVDDFVAAPPSAGRSRSL